jgi:hypothetical protein
MTKVTRGLLAGWTVLAVLAAVHVGVHAAQRPRVSPRATVEAEIDGAKIAIEYGRPSKRERVIWGTLVPWGRWWMPGADESTSIVTSAPIVFADKLTMPAGVHTIYTLPGEDAFLLIINKQTGQFHTVYRPDQDLGRVPMTKEPRAEPAEQLTFAVEPQDGGGGRFLLIWDDRAYVVPFVIKK